MLPSIVLLDLDDTLIRFTSGQPDYWREALESHVGSERVPQLLERIAPVSRHFWSDAGRAFWGRQNMWQARRLIARRALAGSDAPHPLADAIGDEMTARKERGVRPFEGAVSSLLGLRERGHQLGLLTNGSGEFQRSKLERLDLERYFDVILIEGELGFGKPDARVFRRALEHFAVQPRDACMVGDNLHADVRGAQSLGIQGIWHDGDRLGRVPDGVDVVPDRIVSRVSELL